MNAVPSLPFLAFAALAACAFNVLRANWWRQGVLLVCNSAFLASFVPQPLALFPYAGFLALGLVLVLWLQNGGSKLVHVGGIIVIVAAFFWLKRYVFVPQSLWITVPYVTVGLSYVFFRVLHLVIDARDVEALGRISPLSYLNYTLNFTSLVSGPIQRYEDYKRTAEDKPAALDATAIGHALERIAVGLFKVMVVSVALSAIQQQTLAQVRPGQDIPQQVLTGMLLIGVFPIYLFFNFSGYTDFVIGVARLFRIELPENFDRPFSSTSFIEFWSRWHMSLSNWLKTYVYNPLLLVLMRRIPAPAIAPFLGVFALFVTFFLIGAWHGQTPHFFFFGLLNGLGVAVNQFYRIMMGRWLGRKPFAALGANPVYQALSRGLTFTWMAITLLWFWSDWPQLTQIAGVYGGFVIMLAVLAVYVVATGALWLLEVVRKGGLALTHDGDPLWSSRYVRTVWVTTMILFVFVVQAVTQSPAPDLVYKNF